MLPLCQLCSQLICSSCFKFKDHAALKRKMPPPLNLIKKQIYSTQGDQVQAPVKAEQWHPRMTHKRSHCPCSNVPRATTGIHPPAVPLTQGHNFPCKPHKRGGFHSLPVRETSGNSFFKKKFRNKSNFFEVTLGRNQLTASITQRVTGSKRRLLLSEVSHMQIHPVTE